MAEDRFAVVVGRMVVDRMALVRMELDRMALDRMALKARLDDLAQPHAVARS
jgi:hypothetical protein